MKIYKIKTYSNSVINKVKTQKNTGIEQTLHKTRHING